MKFFLIFLLSFSFACSQKPARVVNNSKNLYDKNNRIAKEKYSEISVPKRSRDHEIEVAQGDTIYSLSKKHQVTLHDLIKSNNMSAPYSLKKGERLVIPSPNYHEVKNNETLYGISRLYGMKIDQLVEMNDMKEPYSVKVGDKIRISKSETNIAQTTQTKQSQEEKTEPSVGLVEKALDRISHFSWPVRGQVVSRFGPKNGGLYNDGINIKAKEGEVVKASGGGVVAYVGNELKGYGNLVIIKHSGGWITAYAHLKESLVKRGQKVEKGEKIALVGASGNVSFAQLYFGLRKGRDAVNPENYLKS